jgi:hypothetical protein
MLCPLETMSLISFRWWGRTQTARNRTQSNSLTRERCTNLLIAWVNLERETGFEPATLSLGS